MKTRVTFLLICLLLTATISFASDKKRVAGNGQLITKEFPISDYNEISTFGVIDFVYEQSDAAPYLKITIDENLLDLLTVKVDGKELKIYPKNINENSNHKKSYDLEPTVYKVVTNSKELKELNVVSVGNFTIASPVVFGNMEINMAGSGKILLPKKITGHKLELNLASSGSIVTSELQIEGLECNLAGSGYIQLKGSANRADYNLAASGSIKAFDCKVNRAECNIAGSGSIEANASERLGANIVGSGNIYYKGNPTISKNIIGSGKVKDAN